MIDPGIVGGFVTTVGKSSLVNTLRDGVVTFLADKAKDIAGDEVKNRIESLRSDAKLNKQIQGALERATRRWAEDSPDVELVTAVAKNTTFVDLPSVKKAVLEFAQNPFTKATTQTLQGGFKGVLPASFEEERIERNINEFLNILREEFVAIPALQPTIQTFASLNTANATAVLPNIEKLLEQLLKGPTATEETLQNYLTWVIDQHRYLDPKGTMQTTRQVQVFLDEVYVSLEAEEEEPLSGIDRKLYEEELKALEERQDLHPEEKEDFLENLQAKFIKREERKTSSKPVELAELARKHEKMVILGDPGAGKTTLLRYLALRHAQAKRQFLLATEELGEVFLPVYLRISEYAENGNGQSLEDYIITNIRGKEHYDKSLSDLINTSLKNGECIVFLDGLDEVIDPSQRALISAQINGLIHNLGKSGNHFVVTSRVAGYRTSPLDGSIPHFRVRDMNLDQIKRFLDQWCNAVERFQTPALSPETQQVTAQKEIDSITQAIETNPGVRRLAANPLLLRTLALIHKTGARIPQRRIELYRLAADTLIRDWNLAKGIPQEAMAREADANRLLAELAAWMHENRPAGLATEGDIHQKLCEVIAPLRGKEPDHPDVETEADDFLDKIRQHTGLFVERAPRRFGFMHLTFEEYFAARWLVAKPRDAAKRIRNKLHRPRWEEPILLAIGFYGMEFPDDVTELVEEAILGKELGGPSPYEEVLFRDLLFAVRAVGDQDVDIHLQNNLTKQFTTLLLDSDGKGKYQAIKNRAQNIMRDIQDSQIGERIVNAFITALKSDNDQVRIIAANALSNSTNYPEVIHALIASIKSDNNQVRASAATALRNAANNIQAMDALLIAIEDDDVQVRASSANALAKASDSLKVFNKLLDALNDKEEQVLYSVAGGLYKTKLTLETLNKLIKLITNGNKISRAIARDIITSSSVTPDIIPELIEKMRSPNKTIRETAAIKLRSVQLSDENLDKILPLVSDKTTYVRETSVFSLGGSIISPKVLESVLKATQDSKAQVRESAVSVLGEAPENQQILTLLPKLMSDKSYLVRKEMAIFLSKDRNFLTMNDFLLDMLKDKHEVVRLRALENLPDEFENSKVIDAYLDSLQDSNDHIRNFVVNKLRNVMLPTNKIAFLINILNNGNEQLRIDVAFILSKFANNPEVVTALLATLKDNKTSVRASVVKALGKAENFPEVTATLLTTLKDKNEKVRASAANALSNNSNDPEVVTALLEMLNDESENVRANTVVALSNVSDDPKVVTAILRMLNDEKEQVRANTANALSNISKRQSNARISDLPQQLITALQLPGLENYSQLEREFLKNYDRIYNALLTLAPFPKI